MAKTITSLLLLLTSFNIYARCECKAFFGEDELFHSWQNNADDCVTKINKYIALNFSRKTFCSSSESFSIRYQCVNQNNLSRFRPFTCEKAQALQISYAMSSTAYFINVIAKAESLEPTATDSQSCDKQIMPEDIQEAFNNVQLEIQNEEELLSLISRITGVEKDKLPSSLIDDINNNNFQMNLKDSDSEPFKVINESNNPQNLQKGIQLDIDPIAGNNFLVTLQYTTDLYTSDKNIQQSTIFDRDMAGKLHSVQEFKEENLYSIMLGQNNNDGPINFNIGAGIHEINETDKDRPCFMSTICEDNRDENIFQDILPPNFEGENQVSPFVNATINANAKLLERKDTTLELKNETVALITGIEDATNISNKSEILISRVISSSNLTGSFSVAHNTRLYESHIVSTVPSTSVSLSKKNMNLVLTYYTPSDIPNHLKSLQDNYLTEDDDVVELIFKIDF